MQVKKYNIAKPMPYKTRDGEEKTFWANVGTIVEFHKDNGSISRMVEIPAIGLKANAFPAEKKESSGGYNNTPTQDSTGGGYNEQTIEYPEEDINPDDIPF